MRSYELATPADDATLRALLRDNVMPSWITMSMEREPSYFAGSGRNGREWSVIAREDSVPVGMYACCDQVVHLNGLPVELGYLNSLRVSPAHRNRFSLLRGGFESVRRFRQAGGPELWFTSIAAENHTARRMLEANLRGMPAYTFHNELVTLVLSVARRRRHMLWRTIAAEELPRVCRFHNEQACHFNLSPSLSPETAIRSSAQFFVAEREGEIVACMALWNQQSYRQVVVRNYREPLRTLRLVYNAYARMTHRAALPRVGDPLDSTALAYFAVAKNNEAAIVSLVADALALCSTKLLMFGLHSDHPWLPALQAQFRPERYQTRLYTVNFDGAGPSLDQRPAQPEVALL